MIVFDLRCSPTGHVFEAWFGSSADYESQRQRGLVSCPLCGSDGIEKAVMAPRIGAKGDRAEEPPGVTRDMVSANPETMKEMLTAMAAAQKRVLEMSHYVGDRFAEEARAIHHGETESRSIYGKATAEQVESLVDDGIQVARLPFPTIEPSQEN